jgi:superfamily II DNA/RNA helicase
MTLDPARDTFAEALSYPSLFINPDTATEKAAIEAGAPEAAVTEPVAAEPVAAEPVMASEPIVAEPVSAKPLVTSEPVSIVAEIAESDAVIESDDVVAEAPVVAEAAVVTEAIANAVVVDDAVAVEAAVAEVAPAADDVPTVSFSDLGVPRRLVSALDREGITAAFPIQAATIPDAMRGRDVLGRGQTGSGKTLAFGLPMLVRVADSGKAAPYRPKALVLVPTRELAMQVNDALAPLARTLGLFSRTAFGGTPYDKQIRDLRRGVDILVATPGRLGDLIRRGDCSLDDIEITVLDEADQMADMGFLPDVTELLDKTPSNGQRLLFSATLDGDVDALVKRFMHDAITHEVDPSSAAVSTMEHHLLMIPPREKFEIVASIGAREGRTIMFARTQLAVERLAEQLAEVGVRAGALHGGKTQRARTRTLAEFREGVVDVLVATDVAARGIHVDGVSLVVHIDPPKDSKDYLHRAGRTARAGESGTVVTLVMPRQRRSTYSMLERAGVFPNRTEVHLGGPELETVTGARQPSGVPVKFEPAQPQGRPERLGDRPRRFDGDRPRRFDGDRPRRFDGDRPRSFDDRPRSFDRDRAPRSEGAGPRRFDGDRPRRFEGDRPQRQDDRARGAEGDRPRRDDSGSHGDRPVRASDHQSRELIRGTHRPSERDRHSDRSSDRHSAPYGHRRPRPRHGADTH